jgi:hypothetical protein
MQKWEYCLLQTKYEPYFSGQVTYFGASRSLISTEPEAYQMISQLGNEGWELVSHSTLPIPNNGMANFYTFKRPKA